MLEEDVCMRWEIDFEHKIVDFYIEDDYGREYHDGLSFEEAEEMCRNILARLFEIDKFGKESNGCFFGKMPKKCPTRCQKVCLERASGCLGQTYLGVLGKA